jgi:isoleucyl-tRNA synthetase
MPQVKVAVEALDGDHVRATIEAGGEVGISIDGREHTLGTDELSFAMQPLDGYQVETESGRAVALALDLDDDLIREGRAREVVRAVQNTRKETGLEISDRIELALGGDAELLDAARAHEDYVTGETLATTISYGADGDGAEVTVDGRPLVIAVRRAG